MDTTSVPRPTTREERGLELFRSGAVERLSRDAYLVDSASRKRHNYVVSLDSQRCECEDFRRGHHCKHLVAAILYRAWIRRAARTIGHSLATS